MRFAYLIIAHNEFEILRLLVSKLDDSKNDIYIHFDKKVRTLPEIHTQHSKLYILDKRVDVRWGHVSQIKCEYRLWEEAVKNGPYDYYVLLSGTHLPLKPLSEIEDFYERRKEHNILPFFMMADGYQNVLKLNRYNFFLRNYAYGPEFKKMISQKMWHLCVLVQEKLKIFRNRSTTFYWSSNWVSLTQEVVEYMLKIKRQVYSKYCFTFCADEWFVATEIFNSPYKESIDRAEHFMKFQIIASNAKVYSMDDYEEILASGCLFARKFSMSNRELVEKICQG